MDLSRAKTILILVFLALDSILIYQLYARQQGDDNYSSLIQAEIREVQELLNSERIYLKEEIPMAIPDRPFLRVEKQYYTVQDIENSVSVDIDISQIEIEPDNEIHYLWAGTGTSGTRLYDVSNGLQDFPKQYLFQGKNYRPYAYMLDNNNGYIVYLQYYEEYPIFGAVATAVVNGGKIIEGYQNPLMSIEAEDTKRPILAAATALRRLPSEIEQRPVTIEKIQLGYYSRLNETDSWLLPPVWGIMLDTGEEFYINAFTGELEGLQEHIEE